MCHSCTRHFATESEVKGEGVKVIKHQHLAAVKMNFQPVEHIITQRVDAVIILPDRQDFGSILHIMCCYILSTPAGVVWHVAPCLVSRLSGAIP